jgi:hypothetical protein
MLQIHCIDKISLLALQKAGGKFPGRPPNGKCPVMIEPMHRAQFLRLLFSVPLSALPWQCRTRPTTKVTLAGGSIAGGWSAISEGLVT